MDPSAYGRDPIFSPREFYGNFVSFSCELTQRRVPDGAGEEVMKVTGRVQATPPDQVASATTAFRFLSLFSPNTIPCLPHPTP